MITCQQHDYIEIACLYRYRIIVKLFNGDYITAQAIDTIYNQQKQHCIRLKNDEGFIDVVLNNISQITAIDKNRHFDVVDFTEVDIDKTVCHIETSK